MKLHGDATGQADIDGAMSLVLDLLRRSPFLHRPFAFDALCTVGRHSVCPLGGTLEQESQKSERSIIQVRPRLELVLNDYSK